MINKIISFSLWGDIPKYTIGAIRNAELAKIIYPDWKVVMHIGNNVPFHIVAKLITLDVSIIPYNSGSWNSMFWRFYSADSNDIVISRDTDSRLNAREKSAVDEWLNSDKDFHIMRDHPYHATAILGGMWGCRNGILRGITEMIDGYDSKEYNDQYQVDQNFLREIIYPLVRNKSMVHDEFFENKPFPATRNANEYVGSPYDEFDNLLIKLP